MLEAKDTLDVRNLSVFHNLLMASFPHIEELTSQRENTIFVAAHNADSTHLIECKAESKECSIPFRIARI